MDQIITPSTPIGVFGSGSYDWNIPPTQTSGCYQIKITTTVFGITDTSDEEFVISKGVQTPTSPLITSVSSNSGVAGMAIKINGKNFGKWRGTVFFGDTLANLDQPNEANLDVRLRWTDTQIIAQAPEESGCVLVKVKTLTGEISNEVPFKYSDIPIVSQWRWPRDNAVPIDGGGYGDKTIYGIHTGIDTYEEKRGIITPVFAAADGIVVAKCPDGKKCDGFSNNVNKDNHQLFGVVILAHRRSDDGTLVYSMYADMKDVSNTPEPGTKVNMGDILGLPGITWKGDNKTHVHFEIKKEPVLHNPRITPVPYSPCQVRTERQPSSLPSPPG